MPYSYCCQKCLKNVERKSKPKNNICRKCSYILKSINRRLNSKKEKTCKKCLVLKPATTEYFALTKNNLLYPYCRECKNAYLKLHRSKNNKTKKIKLSEQQLNERKTKRRESDKINKWFKLLCNSSRHNAKRYNLDFEIDETFIKDLFEKQNGLCYWFKIPLIPSNINRAPDKPSLDRINCAKGYTKDNVVLTCMCANIGRNSCNPETFDEFCRKLR